MPRYIVVGVGAVGGPIAARLAHTGQDVVAIARGAHLEAIQRSGLRCRTPAEVITVRMPAFGGVGAVEPPIGAADVVIIATKVHQAAPVIAELAACTAGDEPAVICATNGLDCERQALRSFPRTYGMLVFLTGMHIEPGEVRCALLMHLHFILQCPSLGLRPR